MNEKNITCWVITEGMIGTQNQCVGVAEALHLDPVIKTITLKQPWKLFSPWLKFETKHSFIPPLSTGPDEPWPDLLIASGRKSVAAARYIKKQSDGKTFTVQIQDPKTSPDQFDLVAVPHHDSLRGDNVVVTHGAPNRLTPARLEEAKTQFAPLFKDKKTPRIAVLIGGNSRTHTLPPVIMKKLVTALSKLDGYLMVTASRRTGEENLQILQHGLQEKDAFIWDGTGENPYLGMLAWADHILVTADSVSMISDAATTGKPVHVIPLEGHSPRFDRFHTHMQDIGATRLFTGHLESWTYEPIHDAATIANAITTAMQKMYR